MLSKNWPVEFFDDNFANFLIRDNLNILNDEVKFIINKLNLITGQTVFDQCCGCGDISIKIAERNVNTIGIDQSKNYIQKAKKHAEHLQLPCYFYKANAYSYVCERPVDAAFNWFTSFGYSENDTDNLKMLCNVYKSIKANGFFLLDYYNPAYIFQNFIPNHIIEKQLPNGFKLIINKTSTIDFYNGLFISTWEYFLPNNERKVTKGASRFYFAHDLKKMLLSCKFKNIMFVGDVYDNPFTKDSPRCIVIAQK